MVLQAIIPEVRIHAFTKNCNNRQHRTANNAVPIEMFELFVVVVVVVVVVCCFCLTLFFSSTEKGTS